MEENFFAIDSEGYIIYNGPDEGDLLDLIEERESDLGEEMECVHPELLNNYQGPEQFTVIKGSFLRIAKGKWEFVEDQNMDP